MFLRILIVLGAVCGVFALAVIHADKAGAWVRALPKRLRGRGWGLLILPAAAAAAALTTQHVVAVAELIIAVTMLAAKVVPYALLVLAFEGLILARTYHRGSNNQVMYGVVLAGAGAWRTNLVLPEAALFFAGGLWLLVLVGAPGGGLVRALAGRWLDPRRGGISPRQGLFLLLVVALAMQLLGSGGWFGFHAVNGLDAAGLDLLLATAALVLVFRSRVGAATLAGAGLLVLGGYGMLKAAYPAAVPGAGYDFASLTLSRIGPLGFTGLEGAALFALGLWLVPPVMREHLSGGADPELAARAQQLTQRVQTLTRTRSDAVDTAVTELRRIERDLHDGAQARLVALGMSLQAAERLFPSNPQAALALVAEAKENSSRALTELRDLVRGIYPPVLADRGLADAVRSLVLDTPLHAEVDIDLPGEVELPVAAAVYFSVAEALANVTKHAEARSVRIVLSHAAGMLRAEVTDDGAGGADPALGTGLAGVERRLATFDGILAVSSPPGGPTIVVIEVPCALSSAKTSFC
jgi:signal transduction histidine kinase